MLIQLGSEKLIKMIILYLQDERRRFLFLYELLTRVYLFRTKPKAIPPVDKLYPHGT